MSDAKIKINVLLALRCRLGIYPQTIEADTANKDFNNTFYLHLTLLLANLEIFKLHYIVYPHQATTTYKEA